MSHCTICGKLMPEGATEIWTTEAGDTVALTHTIEPSILVDTSVGEVEVCEGCYRNGLPPFFTPDDRAEIHYQFGLEYRDRGDTSRSAEALSEAREIRETSDILAALAFALSDLGKPDIAIDLYRRALEIEPNHFMARENLNRLEDEAS